MSCHCVKRAEGRAEERLVPGPDRLHSGCLLPLVHPSYDSNDERERRETEIMDREGEVERWSKVTERTGGTSVQDIEKEAEQEGRTEMGDP
jgi:hypothetical protein